MLKVHPPTIDLHAPVNRLQRTLTYRVLRVVSLALLTDKKCSFKTVVIFMKLKCHCTFVASVVLLLKGVEMKMWSIIFMIEVIDDHTGFKR